MAEAYRDKDLRNALEGASDTIAVLEAEQKRVEEEGHRLAFELLTERGLYSTIDMKSAAGAAAKEYLRNKSRFQFDAYCTGCQRETPFRIIASDVAQHASNNRLAKAEPPPLFAVNAICQRDYTVYGYVILEQKSTLTKVGQYPSMADIAFGELRNIDRSLDDTDRKELGTALGLFAHGAAVGAFVYLRRVFERMIARAYKRKEERGEAVADFDKLRMDEKVAALKGELPDLAVENSGVFSILSLGLHELTEGQCTKHFPVIKAVLFQMLEQEEHKRKAAITQKETAAALKRIVADPMGDGEAAEGEATGVVVTESP